MNYITQVPFFDAAQHMYEPDALTKHLPEQHRKAVQFVRVSEPTRLEMLGKITSTCPVPHSKWSRHLVRTKSSK